MATASLIERLRTTTPLHFHKPLLVEAADEIERLRAIERAALRVVAAYDADSSPDAYGVQDLASALRAGRCPQP